MFEKQMKLINHMEGNKITNVPNVSKNQFKNSKLSLHFKYPMPSVIQQCSLMAKQMDIEQEMAAEIAAISL